MAERKKKRRRPGRFRRWVVRPIFWLLALLVVAVFAVDRYLESEGFAHRLRRVAERRLSAYLEREVRIEGLELDLVPLTVEVTGVEIAGPSSDSPPFLTLERALVEAELGALLGRRVELQHAYLRAPRIWLGFDAQGQAAAPRFGRGRGGGAVPVHLRFGAIEIEGGELVIDEDRMPLDFSARDLEATFAGVEEGIELRGSAETDDFGIRLPPGKLYPGRFEVSGLLRSHRFDIVRASVEGADLAARLTGFWRWHGDRELALEIEADGDLAVLDHLGYLEGQLAGPFRFDGSLTRKPGVWLVGGSVRSPAGEIFDRSMTALEAEVSADTNALRIEVARARYGGGDVTGSVVMGLALDRGRVSVELALDQVRLARLLADQSIPIEGLGGGVSGVFNYQFDQSDPQRGNGWADLVVADERAPDPRDLPLTGTIPLVIGEGRVRATAARLSSNRLQLTASGSYDLPTAAGDYAFELITEEVAEVVRLLPGSDGEGVEGLWRPTAGRGRAEGSLTIDRSEVAVRTRLQLAAVEAPGYRADELSGVVAVDGGGVRELRIELMRPDAALIVAGGLPFTEASAGVAPVPFSLAVDAAAWPLEEARVWLPFELPLSGRYSGVVELWGEPESPGGRLQGRLTPARWGSLETPGLGVAARFDEQEMRIESAELEAADGILSLSGVLRRPDLGLELAFDSTPLDLRQAQTAARLGSGLTGTLSASGRIAGTLAEPDVEATLAWRDLRIGDQELAAEAIDLGWRQGQLSAAGSLLGLAWIEGGGALGPEGVDLEFVLDGGNLDRAVRLAMPAHEIEGSFGGRVKVAGSYPPEPGLLMTLALDELTARPAVGGLAETPPVLANLEPVVVELDASGLRLRSLYLGDANGSSEVFLGGRVGSDGGLDLQIQASIASEWLDLLVGRAWPGARWSGGAFDAIATVEGSATQPRINGVGEVQGARLVAENLPSALEDLTATFLFYRDQVVVDSATARLAGGDVRAGGTIRLPEGEEPASYSFQLAGERLSYRSPLGWTVRGSSELTLASTAGGRQLTGSVELDQALYVRDVKLGLEQLLSAAFGAQRLDVAPADEWLASTHLNLRIESERSLRVRNNLADLRGSARLVLRGSLARPVVFGTVELERGGRLEYAGADYEVERGQLAFTNPYRIEPVVDLAARTELREYDISLAISGTPDRLVIDLASNPPLADLDVLALLTGASQTAVVDSERDDGAGVGAESFLYGQATSLIAQRFNRLFGLDKFRIDPLTSSTGDLSSARVTVGERLSRDLAVTYSYDPSQTDEQVLELEWSISRSLTLVLTQNGDGTYALDARWEKAL